MWLERMVRGEEEDGVVFYSRRVVTLGPSVREDEDEQEPLWSARRFRSGTPLRLDLSAQSVTPARLSGLVDSDCVASFF